MDRRPPDTDQDATLVEAGRSWDGDATLVEAGRSRDVDATLIETPVPARPGDLPPAVAGPVEAAAPLLIRLTQLKNTLEHPNPAQLRDQFRDQLAAFRQRATILDPADRERAVRLLALTIDDVLLHDTAWGEAWRQQGLLAGADGGQQLQTLLGECLERRALLELIHSCLALGLRGGYRSYPERWQALREQVHRSLAVPATPGQSPPSARRPRPPGWLLTVLGVGLLLILLGGMAADLAERRQALAAAVGELLPGLGTDPRPPDGWITPTLLGAGGGLVILALLGWGVGTAGRRWRQRRRGRRLLARLDILAPLPGGAESARELTELVRRIGPGAFARLPWYWVLGEPDSGRSSVLAAIAGRDERKAGDAGGGVRWLLTDQAVLIDDGGGEDWVPLLEVLEGHRCRVGALVVVAADRLPITGRPPPRLQGSERRLQALQQGLSRPLPVYLLVSRMDRIRGFREYFATLERGQRHSPWGISDGDFSRGFRGLLEALWRQLPERLWIEADDRRRERLFAFPAQFATLAAPLEGLLETLLPSGEQGPRLAGVYFASAFQQDGTQNRLFPDPTEDKKPKLSLPRQQRRYFITGLPAALASRQQPRRKGRLALRAAVAGLLVILALAGYGWERLYLQRVAQSLAVLQAAARDLPSTPADPLAVLSLLEAARRMPHQDPLARGLGGVTDNLYPRLLQKLLIPRLRGQLEEELQPRLLEQDPVRGLIALEAYRALGSQGRGEALLDWWRGHPRRDPALDNHLNSLLELLPLAPLSLDQAHLARARRYLEEMDTAQRLYAQLRQECLEEVLDHFEPAALDPTGVFTSPRARPGSRGERIPGCFTREGLLSHLPDRSTIQRVLREQGAGSTASADLDRLLDKVRLAYLEDYVAHWQGLLTNLELAQLTATAPADFNRSLGVLERLADPGVSPLLQLLAALDDHLHIEPSSVRQVDDDPSDLVEQRLNNVFSGLHWAARVDNMTSLLRLLAQLGGRLKALAVDDGPIDPVVREAALAAVRDLQRYANYQPRPLERWLGDLADDSRDLVIRDQAAQLNQLLNEFWFDDVLRPCRLGIQGRYPLAPPGAPEASLGDFGGFFGPDGAMAVFFRQYLAEFVDTTRQPWQWRSGSGYGRPALSPDSLALFQRAAAIREGFFSGPDNRPRMLFELEALPGGDRVVLMLDGQRVELQPDGSRPYALEWPAPAMAGVSLSAPGAEPFRQWHGPWGWLALLQEADLTLVAGPWPYQAGLRQVGREILFQLRPEVEHDPFALIAADTLMGFSCPGRL